MEASLLPLLSEQIDTYPALFWRRVVSLEFDVLEHINVRGNESYNCTVICMQAAVDSKCPGQPRRLYDLVQRVSFHRVIFFKPTVAADMDLIPLSIKVGGYVLVVSGQRERT